MSMLALSIARSILFKKYLLREINKQKEDIEKQKKEKRFKQLRSLRKVRLARKYI